MNLNKFIEEINKLNIHLSENQLNQLEEYYNLLIEYNEKVNLTRITNKEDVYLKHFYDSLTLNEVIDLSKINSLCDIGTGAGFPGLVLKIVFPNLSVTLVDSLNKRLLFIDEVIKVLGLENVKTVHARGEDFIKEKQEFDLVTSRAVMKLKPLSTICLPLVKKGGYFVAMKAHCEEEITEAKSTINKYHGKIVLEHHFLLPYENSDRTLIKILKS